MCTPLECQAHFGQKGPQTERQSRCTTVFFVVSLKVARGSPKRRRSAPARFLRALNKNMTKNRHAKNHMFYEAKRPSGQKWGSHFSQNGTPLERQGPFTNLEELEREARQ